MVSDATVSWRELPNVTWIPAYIALEMLGCTDEEMFEWAVSQKGKIAYARKLRRRRTAGRIRTKAYCFGRRTRRSRRRWADFFRDEINRGYRSEPRKTDTEYAVEYVLRERRYTDVICNSRRPL